MVRKMDKTQKKTATREASEWFALLSADYVTADDKTRFAQWLDASDLHRQEYEAVSMAWLDLEGVDYQQFETRPKPQWGERLLNWLGLPAPLALAGGLATVFAVALLITAGGGDFEDTYQTAVGERRTVSLPEGTLVTLNTNTRLEVMLSDTDRHIVMNSGEAFFDVAKDTKRPFTVKTPEGEVRVLGTKFNVRLNGNAASVALIEGRLKVSMPSYDTMEDTAEAILTTGDTVSYSANTGIIATPETEQASLVAWQNSKFVFKGTRLIDVVADVNRYTEETISIVDTSIEDIRVTGTFATDRIPELLSNLEKIIPITVTYKDSTAILIDAKKTEQAS